MTLNELADELMEVRRYVRSHPDHVRERLAKIRTQIIAKARGPYSLAVRTDENLEVALKYIRVDEELLENALYNAAFEIRAAARNEFRRLEQAANAAGEPE